MDRISQMIEQGEISKETFLKMFNICKFDDDKTKSYNHVKEIVDNLFYQDRISHSYFENIMQEGFFNREPRIDELQRMVEVQSKFKCELVNHCLDEKTKNNAGLAPKIADSIKIKKEEDNKNNAIGVVDIDKFNFAIELLDKTTLFISERLLGLFSMVEKDKVKDVYQKLEEIFKTPIAVAKNMQNALDFCYNEKGEEIEDNINYLKKITDKVNDVSLRADFFETIKEEVNRDLFLELLETSNFKADDINYFAPIVKEYSNNKELDSFFKDKLFKYCSSGLPLKYFSKVYNTCANNSGSFDNDLFKKSLEIGQYFPQFVIEAIDNNIYSGLLKGETSIKELDFRLKIKLLDSFKKADTILKNNQELINNSKALATVARLYSDIESSLLDPNLALSVDEVSKQEFIKTVLTSKKSEEGLSEFENTIKNSISLFKEMGDKGVRIKYSREEFLEDLSRICKSKEDIELLASKTGISPILDENNRIIGYNGLIVIDKLDKNINLEREIYNLCHKFLYENEIQTDNEELNQALNPIIKAMPEFINTIGKKQHSTHKYSLDIHQLLVLANSIDNPNYQTLSSLDKTMLKFSCLLHDIAKQESIIDKGHQNQSAIWTKGICKKFFSNPFIQDRMYELVKNHHWCEELNTCNSLDSNKTIQKIAYRFRQPNDFDIAKIVARADLLSVNDKFYDKLKSSLDKDNTQPIDDELNWLYSTGCAIFSDNPVNKSKLEKHKEVYNGIEYKVINFNKIKDDEDMGEYGFIPGKKKNDLYLLVHMLNKSNCKTSSFEALKSLSSSINSGVLSQSLITPQYKATFADCAGVLLNNINTNILTMTKRNQNSGAKRDFEDVVELLHNDKGYRESFKEEFLKFANVEEDSISDIDFANFYRKHIALKTSLSQFIDSKDYKLKDRIFKGYELKNILRQVQDSLIDKSQIDWNEIVGYIPKITAVVAKAQELSEVPSDALKFAQENDFPVILI